ncbi:CBS domain-containing protein [Georgenia halophila]|uniref:CBS domain-containing protein n=1 Tax=Georgenia halophila TaxID=620889 RepID=A0ABP8KYV3_9MICO
MANTVTDVMTKNPTKIRANQTVREAAELMKAQDIGDLVVEDGGQVVGIVTDRDLVIRVLATGGGAEDEVRNACSADLVTVSPDDPQEAAVNLMREKGVRRVPVMRGDDLVGILSIGDLAMERDQESALADISAKQPNE